MYQIDVSSAAPELAAATPIGQPGYFTDGDVVGGVAPTVVPAEFLNMMMMEMVNVVVGGGIAPAKNQRNQLYLAIQALVAQARSTFVVNANATINPPPSGAFTIFDTAASGTQVVSMSAQGCAPGMSLVSVVNVGGGSTQVVAPNGVPVNFPAATISSGKVTAQGWASLLNNGVPQGIWNNGTTYGSVAKPTATVGNWYGTAKILTLSATQVVIAWANYGNAGGNASSQISLVVWNPNTKTYGTPVTLTTVYAQGDIFLYQTGANTFAVIGGQYSTNNPGNAVSGVVCSVTGSIIATGSVAIGPSILGTSTSGGLLTSGCALSTSTFVFGYQSNSSTVAAAQVLVATVSGTTVTFGTLQLLGGATSATPATPSVLALSSTSGVAIGLTNSTTAQLIAFTVSGTTVTPDTAVAMPTSSNLLVPSGTANGVVAIKANSAAPVTAMAVTISGTTITAGSQVTITSATGGIWSGPLSMIPTQAGVGIGSNQSVICNYNGSGQFLYVGVGMVPFSVSGTAITVGSITLSGHTVFASIAPDGTWGYIDTTSGTIGFFTVSANAVVLGATIGTVAALIAASGSSNAANMAACESYSSTHMCGFMQVSGVWYPYYGATVAAGNGSPKYIINTAGDAIMSAAMGAGYLQSNFK